MDYYQEYATNMQNIQVNYLEDSSLCSFAEGDYEMQSWNTKYDFDGYCMSRDVMLRESRERRDRVKNMEIFVLDNSIRESTVAQITGHTRSDKYEILKAVQKTGIKNYIVATFGKLPSVEDQWLQELKDSGYTRRLGKNFYSFSELYDDVDDKLHTPVNTETIGMMKSISYGIQNVIIEHSIDCPLIGWADLGDTWTESAHGGVYTNQMLAELMRNRSETLKEHFPNGKVFFNWRDAPSAFKKVHCAYRMVQLIKFLASLEPHIRPMGVLFEDSEGESFPWELAALTRTIRLTMDTHGWADGHILCHVHKNFGFAEACVQECLYHGATGIWCGISEEGAATGSASSLMTLTNLARLGNSFVRETFHFPSLYSAARLITRLSTGQDPPAKQELYGARALDWLWEQADGSIGPAGFALDELFAVSRSIRVTTLATPKMFRKRLSDVFGGSEQSWSAKVAEDMQVRQRMDLMQGYKWDYQSAAALLDLYVRAGGAEHIERMRALVECHEGDAEAEADTDGDCGELFLEVCGKSLVHSRSDSRKSAENTGTDCMLPVKQGGGLSVSPDCVSYPFIDYPGFWEEF